MNLKLTLKLLAPFSILSLPGLSFAQNSYRFLEVGLFGSGNSIDLSNPGQFETFIQSAYTLFLTICIVAAVIMIVIHGLEYMLTSIPMVKVTAKGRLWSAIGGLIIALTAWIFLYTLNPKFVDLNLDLGRVLINNNSLVPGEIEDDGDIENPGGNSATTPGGGESTTCNDCVKLSDYDIPSKPPGLGCKSPGPCQINRAVAEKLKLLTTFLSVQGVSGWLISESWPPTYNHKNTCHKAGTCVDLSLQGNNSVERINLVFQGATANGLRAVYEVKTEREKDTLIANGVTGTVSNYSHITGPHFSIYNN